MLALLPPFFNLENYFASPNEFLGYISINMLCTPGGLMPRADIYRNLSSDNWSDIGGAAVGY